MKILLEYIKMLQVNFTMISIIKSWCYLARILERFLRSIIDFFSQHMMRENPRHKEENIIKDVRNLFRLEKTKKETIDTTTKEITNLFRLQKENKAIISRILKDIRILEYIF